MAINKRTVLFVCALFFLMEIRIAKSQDKIEGTPTVLKGATVIDGSGNPAIPDAVIVVEKDRIKSVGSKGTTYPANANIVDLSGKFIIPGLVDSHVHYQPWLGELFLN